jgi:hypothetical protein
VCLMRKRGSPHLFVIFDVLFSWRWTARTEPRRKRKKALKVRPLPLNKKRDLLSYSKHSQLHFVSREKKNKIYLYPYCWSVLSMTNNTTKRKRKEATKEGVVCQWETHSLAETQKIAREYVSVKEVWSINTVHT